MVHHTHSPLPFKRLERLESRSAPKLPNMHISANNIRLLSAHLPLHELQRLVRLHDSDRTCLPLLRHTVTAIRDS